MKNKLVSIINSYTKNRPINDFNLLLTINNYLSLDETTITKIDDIDNCIWVSLEYDYNMLGLVFYNDGDVGITLPFSGLFIIEGDDSNMGYDEIKSLLVDKETAK